MPIASLRVPDSFPTRCIVEGTLLEIQAHVPTTELGEGYAVTGEILSWHHGAWHASSGGSVSAPLATILATLPAVGTVVQPTDYPDGRLAVVAGPKWGGFLGTFADFATLDAVTKTNIATAATAGTVGGTLYTYNGTAWIAMFTRDASGNLLASGPVVAPIAQLERVLVTGDSTTEGVPPGTSGWWSILHTMGADKIRSVQSIAHGGETSTLLRARLPAEAWAIASTFDTLAVGWGANDLTVNTILTNTEATIIDAYARNKRVVILGMIPGGVSGASLEKINKGNLVLQYLAQKYGCRWIDMWGDYIDPATGLWVTSPRSTVGADLTHPEGFVQAHAAAHAYAVWEKGDPILFTARCDTMGNTLDNSCLFTNSFMASGAGGLATNWTLTGPGTGVPTLQAITGWRGKAQTVTATGQTGGVGAYIQLYPTTMAIGDTIIFAARYRVKGISAPGGTTGAKANLNARVVVGGTAQYAYGAQNAIGDCDGVWIAKLKLLPFGTNVISSMTLSQSLGLRTDFATLSGETAIGEINIINLTKLGLE